MNNLKEEIEAAYAAGAKARTAEILDLFATFKEKLNCGEIRAADKKDGAWKVNDWVKKGILLGFRIGDLIDYSVDEQFRFFDKSTYPLKKITVSDQVRQVPGGSSIRDGSYVARGVVIMPPAYINVGAYVDAETMVDSHALVGSCAQIGKRVHLSAGSQIGGVLEPIGAMPVIIEDNVLIGGNCGIYNGALVRENAVIGAGTVLTSSTPVYDVVNRTIIRHTVEQPLTIPAGAVVVPGTRAIAAPYAQEHGLAIYAPIIVKYRDARTDSATALEEALR